MGSATTPEWLAPALPKHLRGHVRLRPGPRRAGELTLVFQVPGQPVHTLDIYLMAPGLRALKQFGEIGFGYRTETGPVDHRAEAEFCMTVATALIAAARDSLLAYLREEISAPRFGDENQPKPERRADPQRVHAAAAAGDPRRAALAPRAEPDRALGPRLPAPSADRRHARAVRYRARN